MYFAINPGQQGVDRTAIIPRNTAQDIPVDLLQPQAGGEPIQAHRPGLRLCQAHVKLTNEGINLYILRPSNFIGF
jgi:hypothetical protein